MLQDGKLIRQTLARGRSRDHQDIAAGPDRGDSVCLVGVEPLDARLAQRRGERLGERWVEIGKARVSGGDFLDVHHVAATPPAARQALEEALQGRDRIAAGEDRSGRVAHARSNLTRAPDETARKAVASPTTLPMMLTGLAARGRSSVLAGVRPKKMQKAVPGGQ